MKKESTSVLRSFGLSIGGGAMIIGVASILSKFLGLFRDRILTAHFPADLLDVYYTAFKLPDFIFNILVLGALSSSFIPVFLWYWNKRDQSDQDPWYLTNAVLHLMFVALVGVTIIGFIFASHIVWYLAPGFNGEQLQTATTMTRIMLFGVIFFGLSNIVSGVLNSLRRFVAYSLAPIMYNVGIIFGIVFLYPALGMYGVAAGVVIGAFLHFLIQLPSLLKVGYRYHFVWDRKHEGVVKILTMMVPRTFGLGISQINQMIINSVASTLAAGSIAYFNLANNLQSLPISLFSVSLAIAVTPVFSEAFIERDNQKFVYHFSRTVRRILYFIIPSSILILLLRAQMVRLVYGSGVFDWNSTKLTAQTLGYFALSLFAQSILPVLTRSFYALYDTKTPVITGLISMVVNIGLALFLAPRFGVVGLALAFSLATIVQMLLLLVILRVRIGYLDDEVITRSTLQVVTVSIIVGLLTRGIMEIMSWAVNMHTFLGIFLQTAVAGLFAIALYFSLTSFLKMDEAKIVSSFFTLFKKFIFRAPRKS